MIDLLQGVTVFSTAYYTQINKGMVLGGGGKTDKRSVQEVHHADSR